MDNQREKLIELLNNVPADIAGNRGVGAIADHIIADGWLRPPCKVGDKVWFIDLEYSEEAECELPFITEGKVETISIQEEGLWAWCRYNNGLTFWHKVEKDLGMDWFLSREEAEKALDAKDINVPIKGVE